MTMIALLLRPWVQMMVDKGISPRTLADDLFIFSEGRNHGANALEAMELSRQFFRDIGAKVAKNKCFMASNSITTRAWLRKQSWQPERNTNSTSSNSNPKQEQEPINVVNDFRDLGCHLCLDSTFTATTNTDRIQKQFRA